MLRPIFFWQYLGIMSSLGFSQQEVLADTGITPEAMDDPNYYISFDRYLRLFNNIDRFGSLPALGLEIGLRSRALDAGILSHATLASKSLRHAIEELWNRYGRRCGMLSSIRIADAGSELATIEISLPFLSTAARRLIVESNLCRIAMHGNYTSGTEDGPVFRHIFFPFAAPDYHKRYEEVFRCPVSFNAPRAQVVVNRSWLERPLKTQNEARFFYYRHRLLQIDHRLQSICPMADRVKEELLLSGSAELPSRDELANELGLSVRTLSRLLKANGTCYRTLVDEVRLERSLIGVGGARGATKEIAASAGYRDVNAFRRAFKKWTKQTVGSYLA
ncbi:MAG: AraC family transcriptional regulator ligand-binding domain-containing protein [Steroidobacteraceae bacterium]